MSHTLNADQELVSDVVACQLVIKQILDVIDVIAPVEVREKNVQPIEKHRFFLTILPPPIRLRCAPSKKR